MEVTTLINQLKKAILEKTSAYLTQTDVKLLEEAITFSITAHEGQLRASGEPYVTHPLTVCEILADNKADKITLIAGLLHDVVEDTDIKLKQISGKFGEEVAFIVDGLTKIQKNPSIQKEEYEALNFEKLLIASGSDIRVAIVKIADRLHNMRTLAVKPIEKRVPYSNETLTFFAPLCERLGLFKIQQEIEELGFQYLHPKTYGKVKKTIENYSPIFKEAYNEFNAQLNSPSSIPLRIDWQQQPIYKVYSLLQEDHPFSDIFSIKVVVNNIMDCYSMLGVIHQRFQIKEKGFEDNIAIEKNIFSKYLKTMVEIDGIEVTIHIQTSELEARSIEGIFHYIKSNINSETLKEMGNKVLKDAIRAAKIIADNPVEFYDLVSHELFQKEINVYTPKMDVITLPEGATAIDFAFALKPTIATKMSYVKLNGASVPIQTELKDLDIIEIIPDEEVKVNNIWLNYVKTAKALKEINEWLE
jgi:GTP diphosphokinase / guanosine-3',5'-bis(diphosphate) 3'-diphosphatase